MAKSHFQDLPPHVSALGSANSAVARLVGGGLLLVAVIVGLLVYANTQDDVEAGPFVQSRTESAGGVSTDVPSAGLRPSGLLVRAAAAGATIHVDGDSVGMAPEWQGAVAEGERWVRIITPMGRVVADTLVLVRAGAQTELDVRPPGMRAAALASGEPRRPGEPSVGTAVEAAGSVRVTSSPAGATVRIDGRTVGQTPLRIAALRPGTHDVTVEEEGYETTALRAVVSAGGDSEVAVSLRPAQAASRPGPPARRSPARQSPARTSPARTSPARTSPAQPAPATPSVAMGVVEVLVRPWGRIVIDGIPRSQETDVLYRTELPVGEHQIEVLHPTLGSTSTTVRVTSSGRVHVEFDLAKDPKD